jgi:bifunctional enzyme CysN/CysC
MIASGTVAKGDRIRAMPSGRESTVTRIVTKDGDLEREIAGQSVTLTLADEVDISRGDLLASASSPAALADQFLVTLIWMHEDPMLPEASLSLEDWHAQHGCDYHFP